MRFNQPSSTAIAVNRILDQKPSEVYGRIDANGRVVLFNSNGMLFGPGSQINVGSLLATSLDVVSLDESTGRLSLAAAGAPGSITNNGSITAAPGGSVSLVGGAVTNNGLIVAERGSVNLAAGRSATLDFYGGGLLRFESDSALTENASGAAAAVQNTGQVFADGGQVLLTTSAARNVFDRAVNNDGVVRANRIDNSGGSIRLVGAEGTVVSSGVLDASGTGAGTGGSVEVLGENVGLFGNAVVDVSGNNGGGVALIGGDYQGANADIVNARHTIVGPGAQVRADSRVAGDGGRIIFWADDVTQFYGDVSARGGATSGNGGFTEVSSHGVLDFNGSVNLGASAGVGGHLLLDPTNIVIDGGAGTVSDDVDFADAPADASISAASIVNFLTTDSSLTLQATDNISVNASISAGGAPAGRNLTLQAGENINIDPGITITTSGNILLRANDSSAPGGESGNGTVNFESNTSAVTSTGGSVTIRGAGLQAGNVNGGVIVIESDTGTLTQLAGTTVTGTSLTARGTTVNLNTAVGTLTTGNATTGSLTINNTGALAVTSAAAATSVTLTSSGNLTLGNVNANTGTATLTSTGGSVLDDDGGTSDNTFVTGPNVVLQGATGIGSVDNLRNGTGLSVDVDTDGSLTATVTDNEGEINLNFVNGLPTLGAGDIVLGSETGGATGTVLLQTVDNFNLSGLAGLVVLEAGNTASAGLRSGNNLTLPVATTSIFDVTPGTLALNGDDIRDDDFVMDFTVGNLIFDSGGDNGSPILGGDIGQLTSLIGNGGNINVNVDSAINLVSVVAEGGVDVDADGSITVGVVTATNGNVTLNANGAIIDDGDPVTRTRISSGNQIQLSGTSIGGVAPGADIDTDSGQLTFSASAGDIVISQADSAGIGGYTSTGTNTTTLIIVENGSLSVNADLTPTDGNVEVRAQGAGNNVNTNGRRIGSQAGDDNVTIRAGGNLQVGEIEAATVSLEAGFNRPLGSAPSGNLNLSTMDAVGGSFQTLTLSASGTITDGAAAPMAANTLTIVRANSVDIDTNVGVLNANGVAGTLSILNSGALAVASATSTGGLVDIETVNGALTGIDAASGVNAIGQTGVNLTAGGAGNGIRLGTVASNGTVSLAAGTQGRAARSPTRPRRHRCSPLPAPGLSSRSMARARSISIPPWRASPRPTWRDPSRSAKPRP